MRHYTDTSRIYEGARNSFFFIEGAVDKKLNEHIREQRENIGKRFDGECRFTIIPCIHDTDSLKEIVLRRYPHLNGNELDEKTEIFGKNHIGNSRSRLLYINDTRYDINGDFEADIICKDEFSTDFELELEHFLTEAELSRRRLLIIPGTSRTALCSYSYRLAEIEEIEKDELLERDNMECLCQDLLTEKFCEEYSAAETVSPICFDKDFNISLPLYPQITITLEPLPKTLYILFLQHPEGIILKEIQDYEKELKDIYSMVSGRKNPTVIERMFRTLVDPTGNPLHKNLSIIRKSFTSKLNYNIAKNYIPAHGRAKAHNIPIDTALVKFPGIA